MSRLGDIWRKLNEPRPSRGYVTGWSCPGNGCSGIFRTLEQANRHAAVVRRTRSHEPPEQRRVLRQQRRDARREGRAR